MAMIWTDLRLLPLLFWIFWCYLVLCFLRANLSDDYFTNRQDRYIVIRDESLANFCCAMTDLVSKWSYQADPERVGQFSPPVNFQSSVGDDGKTFAVAFAKALNEVMQESGKSPEIDENADLDELDSSSRTDIDSMPSGSEDAESTLVFPFAQFGFGRMHEEEGVVADLLGPHLTDWRHEAQMTVATGYMNLPTEYVELMLKSPCEVRLVTASPTVRSWVRRYLYHLLCIPLCILMVEQKRSILIKRSTLWPSMALPNTLM